MDKITKISVTGMPEPAGNIYSNALAVGPMLFMSGMTAGEPTGDAYEQSVRCLERIQKLVEGGGGKMSDVVKITVYLTDIAYRPDFGRARSQFFSGRMPCSTLVAVSALADPGYKVEVDATAVVGGS